MKYIILGFIIYFIYKYMNGPTLKEPAPQQRFQQQEEPPIRQKAKNPRGDDEDYIDYEEIEN